MVNISRLLARSTWPQRSGALLLCLLFSASCSGGGDDGNADGDGDGDGDGDASGGSGPGSGGGEGVGDGDGDGDGDGTGGADPDHGAPDENGGGGNTPPGFSACALTSTIAALGGVYSTEDDNGPDDHNSMYGAKPRIVAAPRVDGTFDVAWQTEVGAAELYITHVEENAGTYSAVWHLAVPSLGILGGLSVAENGEPVVVTAVDESIGSDVEPVETHRPGIMELVRLGETCTETYRQDLRTDFDGNAETLPLYSPFTAGTSRLAVGGGTYVIHFSQNTEYDDAVESRHQIGRYLVGNSNSGEVTDEQGNISHSFDQRLHFDGTGFVSLSLGDASLRGIALSYTTAQGDKTQRTIFAVKGGDSATGGGYNNTFTRLGDVAPSKSGYVSTFATERNPLHPERVSDSRNVGLVHSPLNFYDLDEPEKYDVVVSDTQIGNTGTDSWDVDILDYWGTAATGSNKNIAWITQYDDLENEHAERPKIVRYNEDRFIVLWELWTRDDYVETYAALVDEWGNVLSAPKSLGTARLPRGDDAFRTNGRAAWLEGADGSLVLHLVDVDLNHTSQTL